MSVVSAVCSNVDLVGLILLGNVGASTLVAASEVSTAWLAAASDPRVVTKTVLMRLLAVTPRQADALPRTQHVRRRGGHYFLYGEPALAELLAAGAWRQRLRARAVGNPLWPLWQQSVATTGLPTWHEDERRRRRWLTSS